MDFKKLDTAQKVHDIIAAFGEDHSDMDTQLLPDSKIVQNPNFDNAVRKSLAKEARKLTLAEAAMVTKLLKTQKVEGEHGTYPPTTLSNLPSTANVTRALQRTKTTSCAQTVNF